MPPAPIRDSLLRALSAHVAAGNGLAIALAVKTCCAEGFDEGPASCVCWRPVFDREQTDPDPVTVAELATGTRQLTVRDGMCGDCAYRPDSPERRGDEHMAADAELLEHLAREKRFFCHDGLRKPIAWRHPSGIRIPVASGGDGDDGNYQPPIVDGIPYRASGEPALLCAGWHARRRALLAREAKANLAGAT